MTDEDGFIRAILASPRDPSLRLIYADWLEERSDARGEYLRLFCALEALPPTKQAPENLLHRLQELENSINVEWIALMNRGRTRSVAQRRIGLRGRRGDRRNRQEILEADIGIFLRQYARKSQNMGDPNDRRYSRAVEKRVKRMKPEDLDRLIRGEEPDNE